MDKYYVYNEKLVVIKQIYYYFTNIFCYKY